MVVRMRKVHQPYRGVGTCVLVQLFGTGNDLVGRPKKPCELTITITTTMIVIIMIIIMIIIIIIIIIIVIVKKSKSFIDDKANYKILFTINFT